VNKVLSLILGLAALGQATLFVLSQRVAVASALAQARLFAAQKEPGINYEAAALRSLPPLAARIPLDARVLLVSRVIIPIQYEIHFLPRRFALLLEFPQEIVELARSVGERTQWECQIRRDKLAGRRALLSPERLLEELQRADFVVFFFEPPALPPGAPQLEPIAVHEDATLLRPARTPR
jgi:hypothetical protein